MRTGKDPEDHARSAQAKRQKIRHLGAQVSFNTLPGPRTSALKRKVDGTVVRRDNSSRPVTRVSGQTRSKRDSASKRIYQALEAQSQLANRRPRGLGQSDKVGGAAMTSRLANSRAMAQAAQAETAAGEALSSGDIMPAVPAHLNFILEDRLLLPDECAEHYEAIVRSIVNELEPKDIFEAIWTKDIIDLIWDAKRLRRWRSLILVQADLKAAEELIEPGLRHADPMGLLAFEGSSADALAAGWVTGSAKERARVDQLLEERGLTREDVRAHGFLKSLPSIERIDRMVAVADQRRDSLFREIERKRASFAQRGRAVTAGVIDVIDTGTH